MFILAEYEKQIIMWGQNFHNYLFSFLINFSNHFGWITYSNGIVGNVFSYDTSSSDNTAMTYFTPGQRIAPPPIQQSSPIVTGYAYSLGSRRVM